jgi:hypothetical protein
LGERDAGGGWIGLVFSLGRGGGETPVDLIGRFGWGCDFCFHQITPKITREPSHIPEKEKISFGLINMGSHGSLIYDWSISASHGSILSPADPSRPSSLLLFI